MPAIFSAENALLVKVSSLNSALYLPPLNTAFSLPLPFSPRPENMEKRPWNRKREKTKNFTNRDAETLAESKKPSVSTADLYHTLPMFVKGVVVDPNPRDECEIVMNGNPNGDPRHGLSLELSM
ncbi:MAG: hypothetical protein LBR71_00330 [Synergistaceae bacterium]|jgi:hypothetical protein|nr:hypothetical protein [Synergistaceae bacterium]